MKRLALVLALTSLVACNKSPFERTHDASGGGAVGGFLPSTNLVVFSNELKTGGGAFEYPGGNNQDLSFADVSNPVSARSIRYVWNGNPAGSTSDHTFAGFDLMHTAVFADYSTTAGRNLQAAGYSRVTFYARGSLSTNTDLKIEVADNGSSVDHAAPCITLSTNGTNDRCDGSFGVNALKMAPRQLTTSWQQYSITIPASSLAALKDFFKATFIFTDPFVGNTAPGQGGTVYFDQIVYEP